LRESRLSQLVGDAERGSIKNFINSNAQLNPNSFTPSQNFLAENFTLPQGEGDYTELDNGDYKELVENSKINFKITKLKKTFKNSTT
jgi:hypothetical protein